MNPDSLYEKAQEAADFLKLISHPHRLMLLCALVEKPCNVSELIEKIGIAQTTMSNHLSALRDANIVCYTRERRTLVYQICSEQTETLLNTIYSIYCEDS